MLCFKYLNDVVEKDFVQSQVIHLMMEAVLLGQYTEPNFYLSQKAHRRLRTEDFCAQKPDEHSP